MAPGEVVTVVVAGEDIKLPVNLRVLGSLGRAKVCPIYLSSMAALAGRGLAITLDEALTALSLGMQAAGITGASSETLWQAARKRPLGCKELNEAALDYLMAFITQIPMDQAPPAPDGAAPKA